MTSAGILLQRTTHIKPSSFASDDDDAEDGKAEQLGARNFGVLNVEPLLFRR